jgi:hypothetical protein
MASSNKKVHADIFERSSSPAAANAIWWCFLLHFRQKSTTVNQVTPLTQKIQKEIYFCLD